MEPQPAERHGQISHLIRTLWTKIWFSGDPVIAYPATGAPSSSNRRHNGERESATLH